MSDRMKALKDVTALFNKAQSATDENEKKELMNEFWNDAFPLAERVVDESSKIVPSGVIAAQEIEDLNLRKYFSI